MKMVKFFLQHFWMFHDVEGLVRAALWYPGMRISSLFNIQHVVTRRNRVPKRTQRAGLWDMLC